MPALLPSTRRLSLALQNWKADSALFLFVLFYDGARGDFLGALAVASGTLRRFFDVFVLTLLLRAGTPDMSFNCHTFYFVFRAQIFSARTLSARVTRSGSRYLRRKNNAFTGEITR